MKEIKLSLNKEFEEEIVCRNYGLIASCLHASFEVVEDDSKLSLRFITIKGDFNIVEKDNAVIITDLQNLNNVLIHKDLIWSLNIRF